MNKNQITVYFLILSESALCKKTTGQTTLIYHMYIIMYMYIIIYIMYILGYYLIFFLCIVLTFCLPCILFVCFVALCPKSTAMLMVGWSVHLTTLGNWVFSNFRFFLRSRQYYLYPILYCTFISDVLQIYTLAYTVNVLKLRTLKNNYFFHCT